MSNYSDMEDLCLFKEVMANTKNARIDWNEVASSLSWTRKSKLSLRQRLQTLKRRYGYNLSKFPKRFFPPVTDSKVAPLKLVYGILNRCANVGAVGGAIFGEITQQKFQEIINYMKEHCEFNDESLFLDVGSGMGKPNFHAAIDPGCKVSYGVEIETLRWHLSLRNLSEVLQKVELVNMPVFTAGDICDAKTLNPFTHIYSFDTGFSPDTMKKIASMFNRSSAKYYVNYQREKRMIEYGFNVQCVGQIRVRMTGSRYTKTCYFYRREDSSYPGSRDIDPLFQSGFKILHLHKNQVLEWVDGCLEAEQVGRTRSQRRSAKRT